MQIAMIAASFSPGEADELRRSMAAWKRSGGVHKFQDRLIGGMRTGILMLFEPVVAVTLAAILLHEAIRPVQVLGAVGVLGAAIVLRRSASGEPDDRTISDDEELLGVGLTGGP